MSKRLAIYMTYNSKGIVDDYILYMIKSLKKICEDIIVVSNRQLPDDQKNKLCEAKRIYERENKGYDVGAYAEVITMLYDNGKLAEYNELVLLNDSVFGPFYDLNEMFSEMNMRTPMVDFWGITRRGVSDFDGGDTIYPEHLQSYCYIFREKLLHSKDFIDYWSNISGKITDFRSAITNYEFQLTKHFSELGYTWDSYCKCKEFITENPKNNLSPYHYESYELIKNERCPFLKRKLFTGEFIENKYTDASDLKKTFDYIKRNMLYDVDLIWKYILREYDMCQIIKSMQLVEVIDCSRSEDICNTVNVVDVYGNVVKKQYNVNTSDSEYVICFAVNDTIEVVPLKKSYIDNLIMNLYYNEEYICNLIQLFESDARLGVLIPPMDMYGKVSNSLGEKIYKVNGFMCRKHLLFSEIEKRIKKDGINETASQIILNAKNYGYYTKIVMNKNYASTWAVNSITLSRELYNLSDFENLNDADIEQLRDIFYKRKVDNFIKKNKKIYIYGAGQLACRIVDMIADISCVKGIIVSDANSNCTDIKGIRVMQFDEFGDKGCAVIVAVGEKNNKVIKNKLEHNGITEYLVLR